jgi:hypothetical protein
MKLTSLLAMAATTVTLAGMVIVWDAPLKAIAAPAGLASREIGQTLFSTARTKGSS